MSKRYILNIRTVVLQLLDVGGPMTGSDLVRQGDRSDDGLFCLHVGSLFPILKQMETEGYLEHSLARGTNGKLYNLTKKGLKEIGQERAHLIDFMQPNEPEGESETVA
jgi:DNA-binding PadR family transcriptional regulator